MRFFRCVVPSEVETEVERLVFLDPGLFEEEEEEAFVDESRLGMEETEAQTVGVDDENRTVLHELPEADFFGANKVCAVKVVSIQEFKFKPFKNQNSSI